MSEFSAYGLAGSNFESKLRNLVKRQVPKAIGMATAFLSLAGARKYDALVKMCGARQSHVIAGLSGEITHPAALRFLSESNHVVRIGKQSGGIFHPKMLVGGNEFLKNGTMNDSCCCYIGSANFTQAGLNKNLEIGFLSNEPTLSQKAGTTYGQVWETGVKLTNAILLEYERIFTKKLQQRSINDLRFLNIIETKSASKRELLVTAGLCNGVWAGLESFTGEHTFQVEFPKRAAEALNSLLGKRDGNISINCTDGEIREMSLKFYNNNGMYRLNVPNSVPLVSWARDNKRGALVILKDSTAAGHRLIAKIVRGLELEELIERSKELGTLGHTSTRKYGWF